MSGQKIGYIRVSSLDQNFERQLEGLDFDQLFTDKASGKDTQRDQLDAMLKFARKGDTIYAHSMDRLARNKHLQGLLYIFAFLLLISFCPFCNDHSVSYTCFTIFHSSCQH